MRYLARVIFTLLAALYAATVNADGPAPYRLDFDTETRVKINNSGCVSCQDVESKIIPLGSADLCEPDPIEKVCAEISKREVEQEAKRHNKFINLFVATRGQLMTLADKEVPPEITEGKNKVKAKYKHMFPAPGVAFVPTPDMDRAMEEYAKDSAVKKYSHILNKIFEDKYAAKFLKQLGQEEVQKTVNGLVDVYVKMLRQSSLLSVDDVNIMEAKVRSCSANVKLEGAGNILIVGPLNAWVHSEPDFAPTGDYFHSTFEGTFHKTRKVNVIKDDPLACQLTLSPQTWERCSTGDIFCAMSIFHELTHMIDSCGMLDQAKNAEFLAKQYWHGEQHVQLFEKQKEAAISLADALIESSACLEQISKPNFTILDACGKKEKTPSIETRLLSRCGFVFGKSGRYYMRPPEWEEAEADFWGASAFANYLTERFPTASIRKERVRADLRVRCANSAHLRSKEKTVKDAVSSFLNGSSKVVPENYFNKNTKCSGRPDPITWKNAVKNGVVVLSDDTHQPWGARINRNYLRNADLRKALGCSLSKEVPFACSPLGYSKSILPE